MLLLKHVLKLIFSKKFLDEKSQTMNRVFRVVSNQVRRNIRRQFSNKNDVEDFNRNLKIVASLADDHPQKIVLLRNMSQYSEKIANSYERKVAFDIKFEIYKEVIGWLWFIFVVYMIWTLYNNFSGKIDVKFVPKEEEN